MRIKLQLLLVVAWLPVLFTGMIARGAEVDFVPGVNPALTKLIARCGSSVAPVTMSALIAVESHGQQFAIADAGPVGMPWAQRKGLVRSFYLDSLDSAVAKATELIAEGHTISLGLSQVNDRNLAQLGLTLRTVFDPCTNIAAGAKILSDFYVSAVKKFGPTKEALHAAISAYNSGDWKRGANDGYVSLVYGQLGRSLSIQTSGYKSNYVPKVAQIPNVPIVSKERVFLMMSNDFNATN